MVLNLDPVTGGVSTEKTEAATSHQGLQSNTRSVENRDRFPFQVFRDNALLTTPKGREWSKLGF